MEERRRKGRVGERQGEKLKNGRKGEIKLEAGRVIKEGKERGR